MVNSIADNEVAILEKAMIIAHQSELIKMQNAGAGADDREINAVTRRFRTFR